MLYWKSIGASQHEEYHSIAPRPWGLYSGYAWLALAEVPVLRTARAPRLRLLCPQRTQQHSEMRVKPNIGQDVAYDMGQDVAYESTYAEHNP